MWGFGSGEEGPHSRWEAEGKMLNLTRVSQTEEINACVVGFGGRFDRNTRQFAFFFLDNVLRPPWRSCAVQRDWIWGYSVGTIGEKRVRVGAWMGTFFFSI